MYIYMAKWGSNTFVCVCVCVDVDQPGFRVDENLYEGRHDVNFLTDIHDDTFFDSFLFFDADRLDELDFI